MRQSMLCGDRCSQLDDRMCSIARSQDRCYLAVGSFLRYSAERKNSLTSRATACIKANASKWKLDRDVSRLSIGQARWLRARPYNLRLPVIEAVVQTGSDGWWWSAWTLERGDRAGSPLCAGEASAEEGSFRAVVLIFPSDRIAGWLGRHGIQPDDITLRWGLAAASIMLKCTVVFFCL